ncbi:glycosyltransferase [Cellulomonas sp. NPDC058312]|uniref:glycosyltransferase n=1 Tax=Cellulomonas sp. NPDC058312 TaxID=3346441 RepID=UPI0036E0BB93
MIVLIPAYEPDERLVRLVGDLRASAPDVHVVVVDDGSGPAYRPLLDRVRGPGCTVLTYPGNRGKGCALKTGFAYVQRQHPGEAVVCADSDGQHSVADVLRVAAALDAQPADRPATVLGWRSFRGDVPARSVLGNRVTARAFHLTTGLRLRDTQTGLRGYPAALLPWLRSVRGERFEYELNLLLRAAAQGLPVEEVEIATIYLDHNASSHFRPLADSVRVLTPLLLYALSSLAAFAVDTLVLLALHAATGSLLGSVVGARVVSAATNFAVNRRVVFGRGRDRPPFGRSATRYALLATVLLAAGYVLLRALTGLGVGLLAAKVLTEATVYLVGFGAQRRFVFTRPVDRPGTAVAQPLPSGRATRSPHRRPAPLP